MPASLPRVSYLWSSMQRSKAGLYAIRNHANTRLWSSTGRVLNKKQASKYPNTCEFQLILILIKSQARLDVVEVVEVVEHRRGLGLGLGLGPSRPRRRGPRRLRRVVLLFLLDELES